MEADWLSLTFLLPSLTFHAVYSQPTDVLPMGTIASDQIYVPSLPESVPTLDIKELPGSELCKFVQFTLDNVSAYLFS